MCGQLWSLLNLSCGNWLVSRVTTQPLGRYGSHHIIHLHIVASPCSNIINPRYVHVAFVMRIMPVMLGFKGCVLQIIRLAVTYVDLNQLLLHV